jgi:hypothetical protein
MRAELNRCAVGSSRAAAVKTSMALAPDRAMSRRTEESCSEGWSHRKQDQCIALHETKNGSSGASVTWCFLTRSAAVQTAVGRDGIDCPVSLCPSYNPLIYRCTGDRGDQRSSSARFIRYPAAVTSALVACLRSAGQRIKRSGLSASAKVSEM